MLKTYSIIYFYFPKAIDSTKVVFKDGLDHWIMDTFQKLRNLVLEYQLELVDFVPAQGIIIFHKGYFPIDLKPNPYQFFVCLQVDRGRHDFAQYHIVHNPHQLNIKLFPSLIFDKVFNFSRSVFIAGWPINNLKKRLQNRQKKILNLVYHGNFKNLPKELESDEFKKFLEDRGLRFIKYFEPEHWNNFEEADLSICVRDFSGLKHYSKPYIKITNSLLAGVPVIGGYESSHNYFCSKYLSLPQAKNLSRLMELIDFGLLHPHEFFSQIEQFERINSFFDSMAVESKWCEAFNQIQVGFDAWRVSHFQRSLFFVVRTFIGNVR